MRKVKRSIEDYKDIIDLPHHVSSKRPRMPIADRSAQFAPFAAVVGHEAAIKETARLTDKRKELDDTEKAVIDQKLQDIESWLPEKCEAEFTYFEPDQSKKGGTYISIIGCAKKIDVYNRSIILTDGMKIDIEQLYSINLDI